MCAVRFGSYSMRSTTAATPSLSRRKSIMRYFWREPPPMWRVVMRPKWWRAPVWLRATVTGSCGPPLYRWLLLMRTWKRVPGEVGLSLIRAMIRFRAASALALRFVVDALARGETHVGLLPVLGAAVARAEAALLAGLVDHLHAFDLDLEHQLHRAAHVRT